MKIIEEVKKSDKFRKHLYIRLSMKERLKLLFCNTLYVTYNKRLEIEDMKAFSMKLGDIMGDSER